MARKKTSVKAPRVISIATKEANLRRKIRKHLRGIGFAGSRDGVLQFEGSGKDVIRALHRSHRNDRIASNQEFIAATTPDLACHFADGSEIVPERISPVLERVFAESWQSDLFRLAALTWSVPVSNGYGRRLRYLVWDRSNDKLIGLIAIGDPVFNLSVRDRYIGWSTEDRKARLVNMMDAYVLGALPPYNLLLGGKLVACLLRSRQVYDDFTRAYGSTTGIISEQEKNARLLAVTTSSSMGRSSVYNRLKLAGVRYFTSIGYTGGWGHFHIPDRLFEELREYLRKIDHRYADRHKFGEGPNWRLRATRAAVEALGMDGDLLHHGIQREVFICPFAENAARILAAGKGRPDLSNLLKVDEIADLARKRWIEPRASTRSEYKSWKRSDTLRLLEGDVMGWRKRAAG